MLKNRIAFALLMGILTTSIISFVLIALNLGFGPAFLATWLRSWAMAYLLVIPILLLVAPRVRAAVDRRFPAPRPDDAPGLVLRRKLAFALTMGAVTTGLISFALISATLGFVPAFPRVWLRSWGIAYLAVVPAILVVAPWVQGLVDRTLARTDGERPAGTRG